MRTAKCLHHKDRTFWDLGLIILISFACKYHSHETAKIWGDQSVRQGSRMSRMSLSCKLSQGRWPFCQNTKGFWSSNLCICLAPLRHLGVTVNVEQCRVSIYSAGITPNTMTFLDDWYSLKMFWYVLNILNIKILRIVKVESPPSRSWRRHCESGTCQSLPLEENGSRWLTVAGSVLAHSVLQVGRRQGIGLWIEQDLLERHLKSENSSIRGIDMYALYRHSS